MIGGTLVLGMCLVFAWAVGRSVEQMTEAREAGEAPVGSVAPVGSGGAQSE